MTDTRPALKHPFSFDKVHDALARTYGDTVHAKRIFSLAGAVVGVLTAGALTVKLVGEALAQARGLADKHAVKQVDRLLSNPAFVVAQFAQAWVATTIGDERVLWVNLDWTDFADDDQTMLVASLQTGRGRSMPLLWRTATKSTLKGQMHAHIAALLDQLRLAIPYDRRVYVVADRGFGDRSIYAELHRRRFEFVIRFRSNIKVTSWEGETKTAKEWFRGTGKMRSLLGASVTTDEARVGKVLVLQERGMADLWCLAVSDPNIDNAELKRRYGLRFEIEETFRDLKDPRLGMGWLDGRTKEPGRRDRMMLLGVIALDLLTLLGMAGEAAGIDRVLKVNTSKERTLSLVRQGYRWFQLIPTMPEERLAKLLDAFYVVVRGHAAFNLLLPGGGRMRGWLSIERARSTHTISRSSPWWWRPSLNKCQRCAWTAVSAMYRVAPQASVPSVSSGAVPAGCSLMHRRGRCIVGSDALPPSFLPRATRQVPLSCRRPPRRQGGRRSRGAAELARDAPCRAAVMGIGAG